MWAAISLEDWRSESRFVLSLRWRVSSTKSLRPWQQTFWSFLYFDIACLYDSEKCCYQWLITSTCNNVRLGWLLLKCNITETNCKKLVKFYQHYLKDSDEFGCFKVLGDSSDPSYQWFCSLYESWLSRPSVTPFSLTTTPSTFKGIMELRHLITNCPG